MFKLLKQSINIFSNLTKFSIHSQLPRTQNSPPQPYTFFNLSTFKTTQEHPRDLQRLNLNPKFESFKLGLIIHGLSAPNIELVVSMDQIVGIRLGV